MDLSKINTVCVVGFKRSAVSVCDCLLALGKKVKVSEGGELSDCYSRISDLYREKGVVFETKGHSRDFLKDCDLIVLSPGVDPLSSPAADQAQSLGIPVIGEIEFASSLNKADIIAITGTNGKTTTAFLAYLVLKSMNPRTFLAGNIGIPFSSLALKTKPGDRVVLELSSFQLETIKNFRPHIACVTNLEPDHMDRYSDFSRYLLAKKNIFKNQTSEDHAVLNRKLAERKELIEGINSKITWFDREFPNENYSAVFKIASVLGGGEQVCREVFSRFKGLPHRMQHVADIRGVTFINDSKATNPASTAWALKNLSGPVILIAGGRDKGVEYDPVYPYLDKIKKINLFGEADRKIYSLFSPFKEDIEIFPDLEKTVEASFKEADPGDTILLSPMCSSYDMFTDYIERGRYFIKLVNKLNGKI